MMMVMTVWHRHGHEMVRMIGGRHHGHELMRMIGGRPHGHELMRTDVNCLQFDVPPIARNKLYAIPIYQPIPALIQQSSSG